MVAVHRSLGLVDPRVVLPRGRHEQRDGLAHVETRPDEQLERVVQERRVRARPVERRRELGIQPARPLARLHPLDVPVDGVDLAVVAEEAEGLRALPARLRVGREALVEDRPRRRPGRVGEVRVEARELCGRAERLVRDGAEGERRDVDAVDPLGAAPCPVRAQLGVGLPAGRQHQLGDARHAGRRGRPERRDVVRDVPPAERLEALRAARLLHDPPEPRLAQEAHRDARALFPGQGRVERQEEPCAVARDPVRRPRPAVRDGRQPGERPVDELARRTPACVGDEADAAGVSLDCRIVEWVVHAGLTAFSWLNGEEPSRRCVGC